MDVDVMDVVETTAKAAVSRMSPMAQAMKWIGVATVVFVGLPFLAIVLRELPGGWREVKGLKMGHAGGWHQAH
jgi:hypothetical protein